MSEQLEPQPPIAQEAAPPASIIADGIERRLDPKYITASRLTGLITSAILGGVSFIALLVVIFAETRTRTVVATLLGVWFVAVIGLAAFSLYWPGVRYRHTFYSLDELGMRIRRGVIWRAETSLPRSRVQHTDVAQGPIDRWLDLATLIVHTAGTEDASVSLGGLPHSVAQQVRDYLIEGGKGDAV